VAHPDNRRQHRQRQGAYLDFIIHGITHSLTQYTFAATSESGDGLVAAVQVDGDAHADPYQLYLDNSHFYWK
jgi:hypothetical protein